MVLGDSYNLGQGQLGREGMNRIPLEFAVFREGASEHGAVPLLVTQYRLILAQLSLEANFSLKSLWENGSERQWS